MKKAFTLIELLVVIAIIAILAAILFPVFAQAKTAAKKTVAISNQKQIATGFMLYLGDSDDRYPMRRGCEQGSSINPALRAPALQGAAGSNMGCTGRFYNSMSWQTWQKYIMPYVKSTELFFHPLRQKNPTEWDQNGQIQNGYAMNLGLTGASVGGFDTTPWTGGTQTGIPNVASTMLVMESPIHYAAPLYTNTTVTGGTTDGQVQQTGYNLAVREYWRAALLKIPVGSSGCTTTEELDPVGSTSAGGVTVGHADGSARFYPSKRFLSLTPTRAEYLPGEGFPMSGMGLNCRSSTNAVRGTTNPVLTINYPLWGLGQ